MTAAEPDADADAEMSRPISIGQTISNVMAEYLLRLRKMDVYMALTALAYIQFRVTYGLGYWDLMNLSRALVAVFFAVAFFLPAVELILEWVWGDLDLPQIEVKR